MRVCLLSFVLVGGAIATHAQAAPYAPFDVRAAGMGGTGVASAKVGSAALFNPAMLSAQREGDRFQFLFGVGATAVDEDKMIDQVDELQTTIDEAHDLIDTYFPSGAPNLQITIGVQNAPTSTEYQALTAISGTTTTLVSQLNGINNDSLIAGLGTGLGIGFAGRTLGVGLFATGSAHLVATPLINANDTALFMRYANVLSDGSVSMIEFAENQDFLTELASSPGSTIVEDFTPQSAVNGLAIALAETGVGLSHMFNLDDGGQLSLGITPKAVHVVTYDYTANVESFDEEDIDTLEKSEQIFDADLGLVYKSSAETPWQFGLVGKHLIGGEFTTNPNVAGGQLPKTIEIDQQWRAGIARNTKRTTLALDLDLTENKGITGGSETRFLAFGAEYDLTLLQLRAGYRANLADSDVSDVATVGLGLGPVDISAVASETTVGAYLQIGFGW